MNEIELFKTRFEDECEIMKQKIFIHIGYLDMILMPNEEEDWEVYKGHKVTKKIKAMSYYGVLHHIGLKIVTIQRAIKTFKNWTTAQPTIQVEQPNNQVPNNPYATEMMCAWRSQHLLPQLTNMKMILLDAINDNEMLGAYANPDDTNHYANSRQICT
jgi:hypothetical protein